MRRYLRILWPETTVGEGKPVEILYEVETCRDVVTHMVGVFEDGRAVRDSQDLAGLRGPDARAPDQRSLVQGPFPAHVGDDATWITQATFEHRWALAVDSSASA